MTRPFIRQATIDDVAEILTVYRDAGLESVGSFTPEEGREHFAVFDRYPNYRVFVAELDGEIVGTYELLIMDNLAKRGRRSGIVENVAVSPRHQRLGIGSALMQHAREECEQAGCNKFVLSSGISREEAHRFYESIGLKRHGYSFLATTEKRSEEAP